MRRSLLLVVVLAAAFSTAALHAQQVVITLDEDCDDVIFPVPERFIAIHYHGMVNVSADLNAYERSTGQHQWKAEVPVGKKYQLLPGSIFIDPKGDQFYIGNGPLSAVDPKTGNILWTKPFKETGVVRWLRPGKGTLLVLASSRDNAVNKPEDLEKHMEKPRLICMDRATGATLWDYAFEAPKNTQDVHVLHMPSGRIAAGDDPPDYTDGAFIVKGKKLSYVSCKDHAQKWISEKDAFGAPLFDDGHLYANIDKKLNEISPETGQPIWTGSDKIDQTSSIMPFGPERVLCIYPGEPKEGKLEGTYRFFAMSRADGSLIWKFDKGKDFREIENLEGNALFIGDKSNHRKISIDNGEELVKRKRRDDFGAGTWHCSDRILDVGDKGICCLDPEGKSTLWEKKLERAERGGGGFLMGALKVVSAVSQMAAGSGHVRNRDQLMMREMRLRRMRKDREKWKDAYTSPPYAKEETRGTIALLDDKVIFPAKKKQVVALSAESGETIWSIDTEEENPWIYFSPDLSAIAVVDEKRILLKELQ